MMRLASGARRGLRNERERGGAFQTTRSGGGACQEKTAIFADQL